jgi:glutamate synthase (NADPH/NADH) small chain
MREVGSPEIIPAELVLLSMGFVHPVHEGLLDQLGVAYDTRGNVATAAPYQTATAKIFVAGDATHGASLVVRAIDSGRRAAAAIDKQLRQR